MNDKDETGRIRVLVADDHPLYREAVVRAVRARPEFELIGQAEDGRSALGVIRESAPDVAVLDVEMPSLGGVDVVRAVNRDALGTRVILLSAHLESDTVYAAVQAGVSAYLSKAWPAERICDAVLAVSRGEIDPPRRDPGRPGRGDPQQRRGRARSTSRRASATSSGASPRARAPRRSPRSCT